MKAELNLAFTCSLLGRTDMTDTLRGENIGKKKETCKVSFQSIPALEPVLSAFTETSCSRLGSAVSCIAQGIALIKQPQLVFHKAFFMHLIWDPA